MAHTLLNSVFIRFFGFCKYKNKKLSPPKKEGENFENSKCTLCYLTKK